MDRVGSSALAAAYAVSVAAGLLQDGLPMDMVYSAILPPDDHEDDPLIDSVVELMPTVWRLCDGDG